MAVCNKLALEVDKSQVGRAIAVLSKIDILRKLKKRFGAKTIRDIRFPVG